ncbi:hypothetical protein [Rhizobium changzhiense]|uniref:Uncharacterized protein n=1 Tax=Rhizobium changzhiense TaxID=2692317 RepID=A0ABR6AEV3_9HYPH|nr:hypothetical protein [Rhizobium changzhiense]MBA5805168.1 hypothetical protein [Rhizobium changzhiense]MCH4544242.1 hypothetical protein [Rhizobium changzhiense]
MGLDRKLIQAAFLCGALVMPALTYGADPSAEDAFLARLSSDAIPRLQREYLQATLSRHGEGSVIDLDAYLLSENFDRWYVEGVFDGTPLGPHAPIPGEDLVVTGQMFEQWQLSPFMPYYLEGTELPDCAAWLSDSCRWLPLTLTLSP